MQVYGCLTQSAHWTTNKLIYLEVGVCGGMVTGKDEKNLQIGSWGTYISCEGCWALQKAKGRFLKVLNMALT